MTTTAVIPSYQLNGTDVLATNKLPTHQLNGTDFLSKGKIPAFVADNSAVETGKLPLYTTQIPLSFSLTPTGGVLASGAADIFGDPFKPTGGVSASGGATVASISVLNAEIYPRGGVILGGDSPIVYDPRAGIEVSGAALVATDAMQIPTGGAVITGDAIIAEVIPVKPTGGWIAGGDTKITSVYNFSSTGGVLLAGSANYHANIEFQPVGGALISGGAVIAAKYPVHNPSGGLIVAGAAIAYSLARGGVTTPENPYNDDFNGWVINYETNAPSRYERLAANSICTINGVTYVSNAGGIYILDADDDAGQDIQASVSFGNHNFDTQRSKRIAAMYLGLRSEHKMKMTITANRTTSYAYDLEPPKTNEHGSRFKPPRGLSGLFLGFRLENQRGAYFELDALTLELAVSSRMGL